MTERRRILVAGTTGSVGGRLLNVLLERSTAIARALVNADQELAATRWSDAFSVGERTLPAPGGQTHGHGIAQAA